MKTLRCTTAFAFAFALPACASSPDLAPAPGLAIEGPLLPGQNCIDTQLPAWQLDAASRTARVADTDFRIKLPSGWQVAQERPELLSLAAPRQGTGPQARFELFVSPHCDSYDLAPLQRRMATRALAHRYKPAEVATVFDGKQHWKEKVGAPGSSTVIEGELLLRDAEVSLALLHTKAGAVASHEINLAAACPRNEDARRACDRAYRALFASIETAPPAAETPSSPPSATP